VSVRDNLARVKQEVAAACRAAGRDPGEVLLIAVSKLQPNERLLEAAAAGQRDFGENYVQELVAKRALLPSARWHAIGHVQRNKAKGAAEADVIHTVDSIRLAAALDKAATKRIEVLIEIHLGGEETKSGTTEAELPALLESLRGSTHLTVVGLMCIPPPEDSRRWFADLRELRDRAAARSGLPLPHLSMGMSADYPEAILEGATMVRVGTAIFGQRGR
jgi:PLP dependent protein